MTGVPTVTVRSVGLSNDVMSFFEGEPAERRPLDELVRRFERGEFDLVGVARVMMDDPSWVARLRAGSPGDSPMSVTDYDLGIGLL